MSSDGAAGDRRHPCLLRQDRGAEGRLACGRGRQIVTLVGGNGAGKSTTLRAISGLLHPRQGAIRFDGRSLAGLGAHEIAAIGVVQVPEGRRIFGRLTVSENLEMGAFTRRDRRAIAEDKEQMLVLFPRLRERLKQVAGTLSGGEQQMLAAARALMARPRVLLMDEPSMGLAPMLVEQVFETIRRINAQGVTILLVEQNAPMALGIADRATCWKAAGSCWMVPAANCWTMSRVSGPILADHALRRKPRLSACSAARIAIG